MLPDDLRTALDQVLARFSPQDLTGSAAQLTERYRTGVRTGTSTGGNHLRSRADIAAYAAYRMPATYAAAATAMRRVAELVPGFEPRSHLDAGGGTGAAIWAAGQIWPSLEKVTVIEHDQDIIDLGRRLAAGSRALRGTTWRRASVHAGLDRPAADLVTMSYALGELPEPERAGVVRWLAEDAALVVIIEPGTPAGYATVAAARQILTGHGLHVVAPCPHDGTCPIQQGRDWCHFSVRLPRTALHRRVKAGTLSFEDEKFSYVAAAPAAWPRPSARVLRHPYKRKGVVSLNLCTGAGAIEEVIVSKRQGDLYRRARDVDWGDGWPEHEGGGPGRSRSVEPVHGNRERSHSRPSAAPSLRDADD